MKHGYELRRSTTTTGGTSDRDYLLGNLLLWNLNLNRSSISGNGWPGVGVLSRNNDESNLDAVFMAPLILGGRCGCR